MAEEPFYSPFRQPPPPREAVQGEHLWTLTKNVRAIRCELRTHGQWGTEAQLYRDGSFYAGRTFFTRDEAIAHAEKSRDNLLSDGWAIVQGGGVMASDEEAFMFCGTIPGAWLRHANMLHGSSELLWRPIELILSQCVEAETRGDQLDPSKIRIADWDHSYAYLLVASAALECVFKAAALQAEQAKNGASAVLDVGALRKWILTHELKSLAERAAVDLDDGDRSYLPRFQNYMVWAGRYPAPRSLRDSNLQDRVLDNYDLCTSGREVYRRVFDRAVAAFNRHHGMALRRERS